jgi:hypothetical protein
MAKRLTNPPVKLKPEAKTKLTDLANDLDQAYKALALMEELDMDVSVAREKLEWAKKAREMLLREFS